MVKIDTLFQTKMVKIDTLFQTKMVKIDTLFQTKMVKIDTLFQTKAAKNHTLWRHTYLYSSYKGVPPFPRPRGLQLEYFFCQRRLLALLTKNPWFWLFLLVEMWVCIKNVEMHSYDSRALI